LSKIETEYHAWVAQDQQVARLVQVRGSAGIGKSTFLAYIVAAYRKTDMDIFFAIFHSAETGKVAQDLSQVQCSV
jgi:ABC-type ATPase involved in cell division